LYVKGLQIADIEKLSAQMNKSALNVRDRNVFYNYLNEQENEEVEDKTEKTVPDDVDTKEDIPPPSYQTEKKFGDIIDDFLKADPKIKPTDSQYEVDLSDSLRDIDEFSTETLADIYIMQGHKDKAIKIYEQLYSKYPEKHIYFSAQIKKLKE
jgi:tetratricopeptide (TPR) repeat protein